MPWYKNEKPSVLGLNHGTDLKQKEPRLVQPGEVFEAEKDEIPEGYFTAGFIVEAKAPPKSEGSSGKTSGPNPIQGSETSSDKSVTDADAAASKAYEPASSPAERASLRDKQAGEPPADDKIGKKK